MGGYGGVFAPGGYDIARADDFWHSRVSYSFLVILVWQNLGWYDFNLTDMSFYTQLEYLLPSTYSINNHAVEKLRKTVTLQTKKNCHIA